MFVERVPPLGDNSLPPLAAGALPRPFIDQESDSLEGFLQRQTFQQRMTLIKRQNGYIAAIEPQQIKDMIDSPILAPGQFAVEDDLSRRQPLDSLRNRGAILR